MIELLKVLEYVLCGAVGGVIGSALYQVYRLRRLRRRAHRDYPGIIVTIGMSSDEFVDMVTDQKDDRDPPVRY